MSFSQGHWIGFSGSAVSNSLEGVGKELTKLFPFLHENLTFG